MTTQKEIPPTVGSGRGDTDQAAGGASLDNDSTSSSVKRTVDQPINWDGESWRHIPLLLDPRRAAICLPENMKNPSPAETERSRAYWESGPCEWTHLEQAVEHGHHVGLIAETSGLVILDCDLKKYTDQGYVYHENGSVGLAPTVIKHGIDDLRREVEKLGHSLDEIKTYSVRTKSGGFHLYYRQNPRYRIEAKKHHRDEWRIDVITGDHNWVAAPPTPGYAVVNDLPTVELPDWLAYFIQTVDEHLDPIGGRRTKRIAAAAQQTRDRLKTGEVSDGDGGLWSMYLQAELYQVVLANRYGGWNNAIYQASLNLLEAGCDLESVREAVIDAADPIDENEKRRAADTIASAARKFTRNGGRVG